MSSTHFLFAVPSLQELAFRHQFSSLLSSLDLTSLAYAIIACILVVFCLGLISTRYDQNEPPVIGERIPFVGHLIGFWKHGIMYFKVLADEHPSLPVYTLGFGAQRVYVVNTPGCSKAIERNTKALSFMPLEVAVSERILKISKDEMAKVHEAMSFDNGQSGYMKQIHNTHHKMLNPGVAMNSMRENGLKQIALSLDDLHIGNVDLFSWTRHLLTMACVTAVWGEENPFSKNPELEGAFWTVEDQLKPLLVNILPEYLAPSGFQAREKVCQEFLAYYDNESYNEPSTSGLVRAKVALNQHHGFSNEYMARTDLGELTAVLFNLVPASFWLLLYVCSSPSLLEEIRTEIHAAATTKAGAGGAINYLDSSLQSQFPLLLSTYHEVLRIVGAGVTTNRVVLEDVAVTLAQKDYVLKKGGIVQIPASVIHSDPSIWGDDVLEFNPRRFLNRPDLAASSAFRTFGGGASRCPGRHFAQTQVLAFVAGFVMAFDMTPTGNDTGTWTLPEMDTTRLPGLFKPLGDMKVGITRRTEHR